MITRLRIPLLLFLACVLTISLKAQQPTTALMALLAGPGLSFGAPDNWAGPGGMGTPQGQGDWAAMVHDYNYATHHITIWGTYFNPFISRATAKALFQSNSHLTRNAGGAQSVKMGLFFGFVDTFQWVFHPRF